MGIVLSKKDKEVNFMDDTSTYFDLAQRLEDAFPEIDSDIVVDLRSNNEEYQQVEDEISALKQAHPFINTVMEGDGEVHLSAEEHAVLIKYLRLYRKLDDMEREHIYLRGHTDAFAYFKKIKAL